MSGNAVDVSLGNVYELNKSLVKQLRPMNDLELASMHSKIVEWMREPARNTNMYFMFMCRERYDFTIFNLNTDNSSTTKEKMVKEVFELAFERGKVIEVSQDEAGAAYEFWLSIDEEVFLFLLFPYDRGVIEVR